jgi:hypothetical protein
LQSIPLGQKISLLEIHISWFVFIFSFLGFNYSSFVWECQTGFTVFRIYERKSLDSIGFPCSTLKTISNSSISHGLEKGQKSVAYRLVFQNEKETLQESEVQTRVEAVLKSLEAKFQIRVR